MMKKTEEVHRDRVGINALSPTARRLTMAVYVAYLTGMICGFFMIEKMIWAFAVGGVAMATIALEALGSGKLFAGSRFVKMHEEPVTFAAGILVTLALSTLLSWMGLFPWR